MPDLKGGCTCGRIRYELALNNVDDARTTLCHCRSCKVALGGAFGLTAKTPIDMFKYTTSDKPKLFVQDNGVHREFCDNCGAFLCEYGEANKDKFRYIMTGTLDDGPDALPPKGEFFTRDRNKWMPQIPGRFVLVYIDQAELTTII
ncbi:hypothetical protein LTR51_003012 [Lithohypha guttulata]|nr:hypothetical protein LTR51_003012 [Lithohypha guttulata]